MDNEKNKNSSKLQNLNLLIWLAIFLLLTALFLYFTHFSGNLSNTQSAWGTFGDYMGGTLNPLFALLSLFAIIYTIRIQTEELELTRGEMKKSNKSQEEQSLSLKKQNAFIEQQTFENTFFKLLQYHNVLIEQLNELLEKPEMRDVLLANSEESFQKYNKGTIKTYFMTLYQILKFVDMQDDKFSKEDLFDPKVYTNIIRSRLDDKVLSLLAINCTNDGFEAYKTLVEKYAFFEHFNADTIDSDDEEFSHIWNARTIFLKYEDEAFGQNSALKKLIKEGRAVLQ